MANKQVHPLHEKYGTAKAWYTQNESDRDNYEQEWRDASELTLPYIFPNEHTSGGEILPTPYNSVGPAAVNALASKLLLTLLPPTGVFFRLLPDKDLIADFDADQMKQVESELAQIEQEVVEYINIKAMRVPIYEAMKLLIVTGNVMLYKVPKGSFKVFNPYQYVVQRDYVGNVLTACIKETMDFTALPEKIQKQLDEEVADLSAIGSENSKDRKEVDIYTMILKTGSNKFKVWQEIMGVVLEGTEQDYNKEDLPYIILRWTSMANENYGRGLVQQYLGDLRSLEDLTQTIVEGAGVMAQVRFGLRPGSQLSIDDLNNAQNGEFVLGDLEREVTTLQVNKSVDLQVPLALMQQLEMRLSKAFLMLGGQIRDSERTTATEVRATVAELEATLGGTFTILAAEFQTPLVHLILKELNPDVLKVTTPSITTGLSAVSREKDFNNLNTMLQAIAQLGPEAIAQYLDIPAYLSAVATSLGMKPDEIVKSEEQRQAEIQQQQAIQQQQLQAEAGKEVAVAQAKGGQ
jgi:hypothetical protein